MKPTIWPNARSFLPQSLRHQRAASRIGVRKPDEAKLHRLVDNKIFHPGGDVLQKHAAQLQRLGDKVSVGDTDHRVPQETLKAQLLEHHLPSLVGSVDIPSTVLLQILP